MLLTLVFEPMILQSESVPMKTSLLLFADKERYLRVLRRVSRSLRLHDEDFCYQVTGTHRGSINTTPGEALTPAGVLKSHKVSFCQICKHNSREKHSQCAVTHSSLQVCEESLCLAAACD